MLSKEELERNYRNFDNFMLSELAKNPKGLSKNALEVLKSEIQKRNLSITIAPTDENQTIIIPEVSEELRIQYASAKKIFCIEKDILNRYYISLLGLSILFFVLFYFKEINSFKYVGLIPICLSGLIWSRSQKLALIICFDDKILFKRKHLSFSKIGSLLNFYGLFFSNNLFEVGRDEIDSIIHDNNFWTSNNFYLINKEKKQINFNIIGSEAYLEFIQKYLLENK